MSGGYFDYNQHYMQEIIDSIDKYINGYELSDYRVQEIMNDHYISDDEKKYVKEHKHSLPNRYGFSNETIMKFKKGLDTIRKAYIYAERIDFLLSSDDSEESFHRRLYEELNFKDKEVEMDCKNLMIGDWVKTQDVECAKVSFIDHYGDVGLDIDINKEVYPFPERDIIPIPLTEEILKENGFCKSDCGWLKNSYGSWVISIYLSNYAQIEITNYCGRGTDCEEVNYGSTIEFDHDISVHELQHALRICGLNELADNFKVEGGEE